MIRNSFFKIVGIPKVIIMTLHAFMMYPVIFVHVLRMEKGSKKLNEASKL